ncbi:MAG TPA: hypothetical protein VLX92_33360 [Kofleriaceae bacterium]|nr:hypothetical protein [Kofleriaceae bacterium]
MSSLPSRALAVLALAACGGHATPAAAPTPPPAVAAFPATRWVPQRPTYLFAAHDVGAAQRAVHDLFDLLAGLADVDAHEASQALQQVLAVDPLTPESVQAIGIDVGGGFAMFSEDIDPTIVVRVASPDAIAAFFERLRQGGMVTQSVMVDGDEVFTAKLFAGMRVSWVIDKDWMWVHFALPGSTAADPTAWFAHSRHPAGAAWLADWSWAQALSSAADVVGVMDLRSVVASILARAHGAMQCTHLVDPVQRVGLAFDGDLHHASARIALDLGPAAAGVAASTLPPPPGWTGVASGAPLAVQMNLDLEALQRFLKPCNDALGIDDSALSSARFRSGRAVLLALDGDGGWGSGAIALDIRDRSYFAGLLDKIPLRSHLESDRSYGAVHGKRVAIPFKGPVDYVLDDRHAMIAVGDGVMDRLFAGAAPADPPLVAIDLVPGGLSPEAWSALLGLVDAPHIKRTVRRLMAWHDGHLALSLSGSALVLQASGTRR